MEDEEVSLVDGVFEGAFGALESLLVLSDILKFIMAITSPESGLRGVFFMNNKVQEFCSFGSFGNGSSSGCLEGLWWLIMDEKDDEVVVNI
ncbi:hypothetical protein Tco_0876212 [Tanacetum coccineum]|uniref:Uncharacterized protein n=1 Tax=Tanacetum coccineum TaxID=301880 RepID=A0ABQ5BUH3_9ASTR